MSEQTQPNTRTDYKSSVDAASNYAEVLDTLSEYGYYLLDKHDWENFNKFKVVKRKLMDQISDLCTSERQLGTDIIKDIYNLSDVEKVEVESKY